MRLSVLWKLEKYKIKPVLFPFVLGLLVATKKSIQRNKKFKLFMRLSMLGKSGKYKIKPVLFLFVLGFLAAIKKVFKRNEKGL